jgi:uncharacterized protein YdeI (YjbR/CyaY-like superfamily)
MMPTFFATPSEFRRWLQKHHADRPELLVGFYKIGSGRPSMTWSESVDQALCFGWIDGVRRRIDNESYSIRFTPRKSGSIWSAINIRKVAELTKNGLMRPAGLTAYDKRKEDRSRIYSYENVPAKLSPEYEKKFRANKRAWTFFHAQAPSYKNVIIHRIMNAKQEKTRLSRLEQAIKTSEQEKRIE